MAFTTFHVEGASRSQNDVHLLSVPDTPPSGSADPVSLYQINVP